MNGNCVLINGNLIVQENAALKISDLAIQRGYGVFDFFKLVKGHPVFLDDHLERFFGSAAALRLEVNYNKQEITNQISTLIAKNDLPESGMRITLTGGYSADGFNQGKPNLIITQSKFETSAQQLQNGIRLVTYPHQRQFAHVKTIDYLMAIWLRDFIKDKGADEVLYQQNQVVSECPRANFFIVNKGGVLVTPANNILKGIIRKKVLAIAGKHLPTEERDLLLAEIYSAREAFITSSTKNIMPVVAVDGHQMGHGKPGNITKALMDELNQVIYKNKTPDKLADLQANHR